MVMTKENCKQDNFWCQGEEIQGDEEATIVFHWRVSTKVGFARQATLLIGRNEIYLDQYLETKTVRISRVNQAIVYTPS
jgi:hypothetical protein